MGRSRSKRADFLNYTNIIYNGTVFFRPTLLEETEEPVYDLKDHPDFKYRPGSIVIRVANFGESETQASGGQVLDNYRTGEVRQEIWPLDPPRKLIFSLSSVQVLVWWADGTRSFCWPQDLYKVGEYDSDDEGGLWQDEGDEWEDGGESDNSWETQSESSVPGGDEQ